jgi:hypothetical protein
VHQRGAFGVGGEHGVERRHLARGRFLRDIADPRAAGHVRRPVIGFEQPGDDADHRRFTRAVAPDQADAAARRQRCGRAVEDDAPAEADGDAVEVEHVRAVSNARAACHASACRPLRRAIRFRY